jgi:molecular chaperone GrpE
MPNERDKGAFSADIPATAIAEALAAVEKRGATPAGPADIPIEPAAPVQVAPLGDELTRLRTELALSQEEGRRTFDQLKDEHERRLRSAADLENYKKRAAKEREEVMRYGIERLVRELLPVLDSLERALTAAPKDDPLASGVELTRRMLHDALSRFGVRSFTTAGERFDPRVHEALMSIATADRPPGVVIEEQQRGYFLNDRLIRPAAVIVSAAAPPEGTGSQLPDGEG